MLKSSDSLQEIERNVYTEKLETFLKSVFRYNGNTRDDARRNRLNDHIVRCEHKENFGPHQTIRLSLNGTKLIRMHVQSGFMIARYENDQSLADYSILCQYCKTILYDTHSFANVVYEQHSIMCELLRHESRTKRLGRTSRDANHRSSCLNVETLIHNKSLSTSTERDYFWELLRKSHKSNCPYVNLELDRTVYVYDENTFSNALLSNVCATCLFDQLRLDLTLKFKKMEFLLDLRMAAKRSIEESRENNLACRCCFERPAQANFPCGHIFQCKMCNTQIRRAERNRTGTNVTSCSVCKSPVVYTLDVFYG